jgi:hypothetical protein
MSSVISVSHPATELCALVKPAQPTAKQILRARRVQTWGWAEKLRFYLFG